jgi:pimeloyl-ACP methyl ester carboxylesterase
MSAKKITRLIFFVFLSIFPFSVSFADDTATNAKMPTFRLLRFESPIPSHDFEYLKGMPEKTIRFSNYATLSIPVRDGLSLDAWLVTNPNPHGTVIALHGWSSDMAQSMSQTRFLATNGWNVLTYNARFWKFSKHPDDYRGNMENDVRDVGDILSNLSARPDTKGKPIGIIGFSYGATKALLAGARYPGLSFVICDAGPISPDSYIRDYPTNVSRKAIQEDIRKQAGIDIFAPELSSTWAVSNLGSRPILFLHGELDGSVPPAFSSNLYQLTPGPKEFATFPKSRHANGMNGPDKKEYMAAVLGFLNRYFPAAK